MALKLPSDATDERCPGRYYISTRAVEPAWPMGGSPIAGRNYDYRRSILKREFTYLMARCAI